MFGFRVIIDGDYACFTRPEMKVERVSYDVPTPSALEGLLKSVYWKPAIRYVIDKIVVYNPINFLNVRRNEVKEKAKTSSRDGDLSIYTSEVRSQRASMILKNVKYGVEFHFEMTGLKSDKPDESQEKHYNIIKHRLEKGRQFRTPCLGCSEFPVKHIYMVDKFDMNEISREIMAEGDVDLGYMLYGLKFVDGGVPQNKDWENPVFSDKAQAVYYRPHMINGVIDVAKYAEDMKC